MYEFLTIEFNLYNLTISQKKTMMNDKKLIFCDTGLLLKSRSVGRTDLFFMDSFNNVSLFTLGLVVIQTLVDALILSFEVCSGISFIRFVSI